MLASLRRLLSKVESVESTTANPVVQEGFYERHRDAAGLELDDRANRKSAPGVFSVTSRRHVCWR